MTSESMNMYSPSRYQQLCELLSQMIPMSFLCQDSEVVVFYSHFADEKVEALRD